MYKEIKLNDKELEQYINDELNRQKNNIELIASENFVSNDVLKAAGSILTNKYAEGYPGRRYYHGCENIDKIETLAIERLKKLFNVKFANVQAHSGSQANAIAYSALLKPGDKILGMSLDAGGHLTHGYHISFSGIIYDSYSYGVDGNGILDYEAIKKLAQKIKPKLIIAGASAYSRIIDFKKFREIADLVEAYLVVDIAHIAGLIAAGEHPAPFNYAHIVTSTVHKTLRGARGGILLTNDEQIAKKINKSCFPGHQGGPLENLIAGKAVAFKEALSPEYKLYIKQVVKNAKVMANYFLEKNVPVISGGTDNHLFILDVNKGYGLTGKQAANILHEVSITLNMNSIPNDVHPPMLTSGIRIGSPAMTTRGFKENEFLLVAEIIHNVLSNIDSTSKKDKAKELVKKLTNKFPL